MERLHVRLQDRGKKVCEEILASVLASAKQRRRTHSWDGRV